MKRLRIATLLVALAGTVAVALVLRGRTTDTQGGDAHLPLNPFVAATKGDWAVLVATSREDGKKAEAEVFVHRIVAISGTEATTRLDARTHQGTIVEGATRTFSTVDEPTLAAFFTPANARYEISNATVERATREVFARRFACSKVAFDRRDLGQPDAPPVHVTAWLSPEVRGCGILHAILEGRDPKGGPTTVTFELLGFGHDATATLGKTPDEVPLDSKPVLLPTR